MGGTGFGVSATSSIDASAQLLADRAGNTGMTTTIFGNSASPWASTSSMSALDSGGMPADLTTMRNAPPPTPLVAVTPAVTGLSPLAMLGIAAVLGYLLFKA